MGQVLHDKAETTHAVRGELQRSQVPVAQLAKRYRISRLPKADREKPKKFKNSEIGYFHIDIAELRYEGSKGFLYMAVDRTSKLVFACI